MGILGENQIHIFKKMNKYKLALFTPLTMPLASFPDNVGNVSFYQSFYLNNSKAHC